MNVPVYIILISSVLYDSSESVKNSITITHVEPPKYTQSDYYDKKIELECKNWLPF